MNLKIKNKKISANDYPKKFLAKFKKAKTNSSIIAIINKIYEDGFYDGIESEQSEHAKK